MRHFKPRSFINVPQKPQTNLTLIYIYVWDFEVSYGLMCLKDKTMGYLLFILLS